jgi:hypothetical protein
MIRRAIPILLLLLVALPLGRITRARAIDGDPSEFLPSGAGILRTAQGDVDGDGRDDLVTLYTVPGPGSGPSHASLLVLLTTDDVPRPVHLFGKPPSDLRDEPVLDPQGSTDLALRDLTGDGRSEIVLTLVNRFQNTFDRKLVWVFGQGDAPPARDAELGPPPPPWAGTGFRLAAFVEGAQVDVIGPDEPGGSALRRQDEERAFTGPSPSNRVSEMYRWRGDGFRLDERTLMLPSGVDAGRAPETAVLGFYQAISQGDRDAAAGLLDAPMRGAAPGSPFADPTAALPDLHVEEVRLIDTGSDRRARASTDQTVYVRGSFADQAGQRRSFAGTWLVHPDGDRWRLAAADLHATVSLAALADGLPSGTQIVQTASGDLRGRGVDDHVVLAGGPGRFPLLEPFVLFAGEGGLAPAVPLASFVHDTSPGGPAGQVQIADVNHDGTPEVTFSGIVGAHSALLWVLRWDGSALAPLFEEVSSTPVVSLTDLDDDGIAEIVLLQSGYCGSYAASPSLSFVFHWEDGAYRSASMRYPAVNDGVDEHANGVITTFPEDSQGIASRACIEHMLATVNAFRGKAAETRAAYRGYADLSAQADDRSTLFVRPVYLGEPYVEADLRAALAAAESGQTPGWGPADLAVLHDLLGDGLDLRAQIADQQARSYAERNLLDQAASARQRSDAARAVADQEYRTALALDPDDGAARRALGE